MQGVGYSFSCLGPFLVGWLHTVSDGWTLPFSFLFGCATLMLCASWVACKPRKLEDLW
jgi:CP family cyanate transporter-like MFS transporter